ncbi:MAG: hypothetical protein DRP45_01345 [Candidatus Zixiibacteriota bacterium]|nr:MAG: hypothetical protein DRP45_01345 [candidate division Zixibacteria bacterium]
MTTPSDYTVNMPREAAWIVYINGLEIPVMGVDVTYGVWQIPTAAIRMVPHPMLQRLGAEDRLHVVIFYKDDHMQGAVPQFRLLGEFEVVGWTYTNSPSGRALQLDCVSPVQIFKQLHCFYMSSMDDIVAAQGLSGDASAATQAKVFYPTSLFLEGLFHISEAAEGDPQGSTVPSDDFIKRPIDFVTNVFRAVLLPIDNSPESIASPNATTQDGHIPRDAAAVPGKNFFARWCLRTQFHAKWCALPMFEDDTPVPAYSFRGEGEPSPEEEAAAGEKGHLCFPLVKAVQDYQVVEALQQHIGANVGNAGSIWDLLKMVYSQMYMELAMIPCPPAGAIQKKTGHIKAGGGATSDEYFGIRSFFVKPQCIFGLPPICNVMFPSVIQNFTFQETYITQPTRLYLGESFLSHVLDPDSRLGGVTEQLLTTGFPPVVKNRMRQAINSTHVNNKNFLVEPEELYKGPVSRRMSAPPWMYLLQQNAKGTQESPGASPSPEDEAALAAIGAGGTVTGLGALFDKYAEYEYYRSRFAERQGGVSMVFNPYILPGFPGVVYDQRASGFDVLGYVMSVTHSMSAERTGAHQSTQVNLSFIRTLDEIVDAIFGVTGVSSLTALVSTDSYPAEPIPSVRDVFQKQESAEEFYKILLYGPEYPGKQQKSWHKNDITNGEENPVTGVYDRTPTPEWAPAFDGADEALRAISRPVCTLKEYIESYHQRDITELLADGTVRGEYRSFYTEVNNPSPPPGGAVFWGRIYKNTPAEENYKAPEDVVNVSQSEDTASQDTVVAGDIAKYGPVDEWRIASPQEVPDTIKDWDKILEEYRKILRSEEGKVAPQE